MREIIVVATIDRTLTRAALEKAQGAAAWLEVRADLAGEVDVPLLRRHFDGKLLFTLRSRAEGGESDAVNGQRRERLIRAAAEYDLIDLEPQDLVPRVLGAIAPERRVISTCRRAADDDELRFRVERLLATPAAMYRVAPLARKHAEALAPLRLIAALGRDDVCAYADGILGVWTRIVAPQLGAPAVFGTLDGDTGRDGVPTVAQLALDYGFPHPIEAREIFAIAGDPIYTSLSPRLHNAAFRATGRAALYIPFHVPSFAEFWLALVKSCALDELGLPLKTICVVSPNKEVALAAATDRTPIVRRARSTNFFVRQNGNGAWTADTTDPAGVLLALGELGVEAANQKVAVVGCGGSGRAVAAALQHAGAEVTLVNRGFDRGSLAVTLLRLPFLPLAGFSADEYSIVVNATPVGRNGDDMPFSTEHLREDAVVIDLVYGNAPTLLISKARERGQITIDGKQILIKQAMRQFRLMTGEDMPEHVVRGVLGIEPALAPALPA
ncbi:MAG TPA: type I 3-dehydroquinate dehydratase [Thermoanaerobaculia bacterium]|nr:type I 3-dehydroquinate dehydratase [Thermoanaerobaculia bacterium]